MVTVTIPKAKYEILKREARAWRGAVGTGGTVIFNAARDNGGKGIPATKLLRILRKLEREETKRAH
jgi:hypothetical protein